MTDKTAHAEQPAVPEPAPGPEPESAAEQTMVSPGVYKRLTTGLGGFTMALLACFALAGLVVLITPRSNKEILPTVDYSPALLTLRTVAPYTSYAPVGLPAGWRPTSSRLTGGRGNGPVAYHLGFVTPGEEYAALEESNEAARPFVTRMTNRDRAVGSRQVAGASWDEYFREDKGQRSLVRRLDGLTLVVTGTASYDELAVLAASLRPQERPGASPAATPS